MNKRYHARWNIISYISKCISTGFDNYSLFALALAPSSLSRALFRSFFIHAFAFVRGSLSSLFWAFVFLVATEALDYICFCFKCDFLCCCHYKFFFSLVFSSFVSVCSKWIMDAFDDVHIILQWAQIFFFHCRMDCLKLALQRLAFLAFYFNSQSSKASNHLMCVHITELIFIFKTHFACLKCCHSVTCAYRLSGMYEKSVSTASVMNNFFSSAKSALLLATTSGKRRIFKGDWVKAK